MFRNDHLIEKTVEITVAKLSNTSTPTNESNGKNVAEFMQEIYDKLVELNKEDQPSLALAVINSARAWVNSVSSFTS